MVWLWLHEVCKVEVQGGPGIPAEQTVNKMQLQLYCVG